MRKIFFTIAAIGLLVAGSANAQKPKFAIGGLIDVQFGTGAQEGVFERQSDSGVADNSNTSIFERDPHKRVDTHIDLSLDGKTNNGLEYGTYTELYVATNTAEGKSADNEVRRANVFLENHLGKTVIGAVEDAGDILRVDATNFSRATGGIGGDFKHYVDLRSGAIAAGSTYYITPGLPTASGIPGEQTSAYGLNGTPGVLSTDNIKDRATANKISYYSPRIKGIKAGISYTPDQRHHLNTSSVDGGVNFSDVWNAGLHYDNQFDTLIVTASITGEVGQANNTNITAIDDLQAIAIGATISRIGFTFGGSWAQVPEYGATKSFNSSLSYWTLGGAYEFGPFATSITYFDSTVENGNGVNAADQDFSNVSIGADYRLSSNLMPYAEISFFETDNGIADTSTTVDNQGTVFIVGTQITF